MEDIPFSDSEQDVKPNHEPADYDLVWHTGDGLFDGRYRLEVRRSKEHGSTFHVLDGYHDMQEVKSCPFDYIPEAQQNSPLWNAIIAKRLAIRILDAPYL